MCDELDMWHERKQKSIQTDRHRETETESEREGHIETQRHRD